MEWYGGAGHLHSYRVSCIVHCYYRAHVGYASLLPLHVTLLLPSFYLWRLSNGSFWWCCRLRGSPTLSTDQIHEVVTTLLALLNVSECNNTSLNILHTFSASVSQPLPNFARKAANFPASSSSTFNSFCELGFHNGAFLISFALLYTG